MQRQVAAQGTTPSRFSPGIRDSAPPSPRAAADKKIPHPYYTNEEFGWTGLHWFTPPPRRFTCLFAKLLYCIVTPQREPRCGGGGMVYRSACHFIAYSTQNTTLPYQTPLFSANTFHPTVHITVLPKPPRTYCISYSRHANLGRRSRVRRKLCGLPISRPPC